MKTITNTNIINQIEINWKESTSFSGTQVINCPPELRVIKDFFYKSYWGDIILIARGVNEHYGVGINESGFRFASDLEPGEEVFEGVELFDPLGEVYIEEEAFEKLILKFFKAVIQGSISNTKLSSEAWWNEFVTIVSQIEQKVA